MKHVLVFAGTTEGREIVEFLAGLPVTSAVAEGAAGSGETGLPQASHVPGSAGLPDIAGAAEAVEWPEASLVTGSADWREASLATASAVPPAAASKPAGRVACTVCVATEYGKALLEPSAGVRVLNRRIDAAEMRELIITSGIDLVIDATHPYAVAVSANIREAAAGTGVECLRLIREPMVEGHQGDGGTVEKGRHGDGTVEKSHQARGSVEKGRQEDGSISQADGCEYYADTEGIVRRLNELEGRILLTTGSKDLPAFTAVRDYSRRMYPRVLPALESLQICRELGYELSRVIGMQGPFSEELNIALLRQFDIRVLVTKESGAAGGFAEKVSAARKLGIPVLVLNRPVREQGYTLAELKRELSRRYGQEERGNG